MLSGAIGIPGEFYGNTWESTEGEGVIVGDIGILRSSMGIPGNQLGGLTCFWLFFSRKARTPLVVPHVWGTKLLSGMVHFATK